MFDQAYAQAQLARSRHPVRSLVRGFYLSKLLRFLQEPTLDVGCGAGQLLQKLPAGSIGTEVNPYLVNTLQAQGLCVLASRPESPTFLSEEIKQAILDRGIRAICLGHVLEHWIRSKSADCLGPYRLVHSSYFPFNHCLAGRFYIYNELIMLFHRSSSS